MNRPVKKKLLKIPAVMNSRFLLTLLKIIVHGELSKIRLNTISTFVKMLDIGSYSKDTEVKTLYASIEVALNCKIDDLKDNHLLNTLISSTISNDNNTLLISDIIEPTILNEYTKDDNEINYIMEIVNMYSQKGFILDYKEELVESLLGFESGSSQGLKNTIEKFKRSIGELNTKLHKILSSDAISMEDPITISDPEFMSKYFKKIFHSSKRKTKVLKTGLKLFNKMLSKIGGFITGKMYVIHAPINSFKSGLLLYIAKWIQLYNSEQYVESFKKTGKRPCVVVFSFENTPDETLERMFSMYSYQNMSEVATEEEAEGLWNKFVYKTNSIIDIQMYYCRSNRFSASDMEYKLDEIESNGYIVIACLVDYMRVMRDDHNSQDPRSKIINIATDLREISATRPNLVMISAHHTNRDGDKLLKEIGEKGGVDRVKHLGRQHLVDANAVEDPIDFSVYVYPEISPYDGEKYLTFGRGKTRYERTDVDFFAHHLKSGFFIEDDYLLDETLSITSIEQTIPTNNTNTSISSNINNKNTKKPTISKRDVSDENLSEIFSATFE